MDLPKELEGLKDLRQWVCYRMEWNAGKQKFSKRPINPASGYGAKANDPTTWGSFAEAVYGVEHYHLDGIGFEFASGYMGIDLDGVIDEGGNLNDLAAEIVQKVDSYTEYSPSGKGLHILCRCQDAEAIGARNDKIGLEMYGGKRFFTITGKPYGKAKPIQDRTEAVKTILGKYMRKPAKAQPAKSPVGSQYQETAGDHELWEKMFNSQKGQRIRALYNGDISGYDNDHSRADQALINDLAYWTNGDASRMDAMFRQTGLMRDKWDQRRGAQTYGQKTIAAAIANLTPYSPPARPAGDAKGANMKQNDQENQNPQENPQAGTQGAKEPAKQILPESIRDYIMGTLKNDLQRFQSYSDRKTGFSNIDEITSLYPGLYVLGATTSLGKTTFAHQMADQLAREGNHILYFSLEQSRLELITKGISRLTAKSGNHERAVSAIDIRRGTMTDTVKQAIEEYAKFTEHEIILECSFDTTIDNITNTIKDYIKQTDVRPIVFLDYLQIVRPTDPRQTTKDAVDGHVRALKKLQVDNDLVVFVISSLNRQNYLTPIDFESFKESGGIEYTADVLWGLQLQIMNSDLFDKQNKLKEKREEVRKAKKQIPREVELVCLKNRYGTSSYSCGFRYYPQFDYFVPDDDFDPAAIASGKEIPWGDEGED